MDGLEAIELQLSEVLIDNDSRRIDSEFFNKLSLIYDRKLKKLLHLYLDDVVSGPFGSTLKSHNYLSDGIPFIRVENLKDRFTVKKDELVYISDENNELLRNSQLFLNDLVMSKVGNTIGLIARVDEELKTCNISENNLGIKLKKFTESEQLFILTYLNCEFAQNLILRRVSGNAQPKLNVGDMSKIPIPIFSNDFQLSIGNLVKLAHQRLEESKQLYKETEKLLLSELGLLDFVPNSDNIAIKSFSGSFSVSGRLDSEYYQPKYDDIILHIKQTKHDRLGGIVDDKKSIEPGSEAYQEEGIPFVRVSNVSKFEITAPDIHLPYSLFSADELEVLQPRKDTILLSKDGTVGIAHCIKEAANIITSGALLHLTIKSSRKAEVLPEYLTLVLNSKVVQMQAEQDAGGSIIQHWKPSEIQEVLIPILSMSIQEQIETKVKQSFILKEQSKQLLDLAKRAVEVAIEESEQSAMELINNAKY